MNFLLKPLDKLVSDDLGALIENEILEAKFIDYKIKLNLNTDSEKKEFLADISSFANTIGGYLLIGIKEQKGIPVEIVGFESKDIDSYKLKIEQIIHNGIQPRINGISLKPIKLENDQYVLVIFIPNSFLSPHMVSIKNLSKFYGRNSAGKFQMDVSEIRMAFIKTDSLNERAKHFREVRISKALSGEFPINVPNVPLTVLHFLPLISFHSQIAINFDMTKKDESLLSPLFYRQNNYRHNFDGYLSYYEKPDGVSISYLQVFRNGCLETLALLPIEIEANNKWIYINKFEEGIATTIKYYLQLMNNLEIGPSFIVSATVINSSGYKIKYTLPFSSSLVPNDVPIDKDALILPEVEIMDSSSDIFTILKPIFDTLWNTCGWPRSMNYDKNGKRHTT